MSGGKSGPGSWIDRLVGWSIALLVAAIAINCAVALIEQVLPALLIGLGTITLVGVVVGAVWVVRWWRYRP